MPDVIDINSFTTNKIHKSIKEIPVCEVNREIFRLQEDVRNKFGQRKRSFFKVITYNFFKKQRCSIVTRYDQHIECRVIRAIKDKVNLQS
jgi:hypothetical protein